LNINKNELEPLIKQTNRFYRGNHKLYHEIGAHFKSPETYICEFTLRNPEVRTVFLRNGKGLNFVANKNERIHRWTNYLEGFSKDFVLEIIRKFKLNSTHTIMDPFAGSGTVNVCAKMKGIPSVGIEINPTIYRVLKTKISWDMDPQKVRQAYRLLSENLSQKSSMKPPEFLDSARQFHPGILENILRIREQITKIKDEDLRKYFELAFQTILLPSSNLKRSPSIGYDKKKTKNLYPNLPFELFRLKIEEIADDLEFVQEKTNSRVPSFIYNADSKRFDVVKQHRIDAVITSPPYLNSFDYPGNYKLEMGWMGDALSTSDLRALRDEMILCDNVSRTMIKDYAKQPKLFSNDWIDYIVEAAKPRMKERIGIRRKDYPILLRKYFEDIYSVLQKIYKTMNDNGKVAWVVGDSLILDVYVPTDLITMILAKMIGFKPVKIEIHRVRRSGIRRSFILRESVLYFEKSKRNNHYLE